MPASRKRPATAKSSSKKRSPVPAVRDRARRSEADPDESFTGALAALLRERKIVVPRGLTTAPPQAYAGQPASVVDQLSRLSDGELKQYAEKVAGYVTRQTARAKAAWEGSPLITELRRRKLKEPPMPARVVGISVSLTKPLKEWSDKEILGAVAEWVKRSS
jgi:hypothetical protein